MRFLPGIFFLFSFFFAGAQQYEFRGVWMATVDNIDWPQKGQFNVDSQKTDYLRQLDMHQRNGLNAIIFQVRPATDAFYPSQYEPWSQWLTGRQGLPPVPFYDPLEFTLTEAHKRGFEYHAWCNPYRAVMQIGKSSIAPTHITRLHPEWFVSYGGKLYFDPGIPEAQEWVVNVMKDIVARYDIDGLHMDDYFYPYKVPGKDFPDAASFRKYGNGMGKAEWRRSNVDSIIYKLSKAIKETKPWVKFGISPFGIWRNKYQDPEGSNTRGLSNYDDLYANILLWLKNDWIDYVSPQIYWEFSHASAPYGVLLNWWNEHTYGKHCYVGLGMYRAGTNAAWRDKKQLPRQVDSLRKKENIQGAIYFSSRSFIGNPNGWSDSLRYNYYREPALIPPMEWLPPNPLRSDTTSH
jgi:uncharacterized lipoprotein YddW (UPF0748 family)